MKRVLHGFAVLGMVLGLLVSADIVMSGSFEDSFTRTAILPNIANYTTANLPSSTQIAGRMAYDSTLQTLTVDDGTGWRPLVTRFFSRFASHVEVTQAVAPTVSACTGGSVGTGSSDTAGRVSSITGTICTILFNQNYVSSPFAVVTRSSTQGGNNAIRHLVYTTGIDVFGLSGGNEAISYVVIGRY